MAATDNEAPANPKRPGGTLAEDLRAIEQRRPFRWGLLIGALVTVASALLIVQNGHSTRVQWLWFDFDMPQWLLLAATLVVGAVIWEAGKLAWHRARSRGADRRQVLTAARRRLRRS